MCTCPHVTTVVREMTFEWTLVLLGRQSNRTNMILSERRSWSYSHSWYIWHRVAMHGPDYFCWGEECSSLPTVHVGSSWPVTMWIARTNRVTHSCCLIPLCCWSWTCQMIGLMLYLTDQQYRLWPCFYQQVPIVISCKLMIMIWLTSNQHFCLVNIFWQWHDALVWKRRIEVLAAYSKL